MVWLAAKAAAAYLRLSSASSPPPLSAAAAADGDGGGRDENENRRSAPPSATTKARRCARARTATTAAAAAAAAADLASRADIGARDLQSAKLRRVQATKTVGFNRSAKYIKRLQTEKAQTLNQTTKVLSFCLHTKKTKIKPTVASSAMRQRRGLDGKRG